MKKNLTKSKRELFINMVRYCSVPLCKSKYGAKDIRFHQFPTNARLRNIWCIKFCMGREPSKTTVACSIHFKQDDYIRPTKAPPTAGLKLRLCLKPYAVPSLNLPHPSLCGTNYNNSRKKIKFHQMDEDAVKSHIKTEQTTDSQEKHQPDLERHLTEQAAFDEVETQQNSFTDKVDETSMTDKERSSEDTLSCSEKESTLHQTLDKEITNEQGSSIPGWYSVDITSKNPNVGETAVPMTPDKNEVFKLVTPKIEIIETEETRNADEVCESHTSTPFTEPKHDSCDNVDFDELSNYGQHIINRLRKYGPKTQAYLKIAFNNLLCEADLGKFEEKVTEIPDTNLKTKVKTVYVNDISQCPPQSNVVPHFSGTSACDFILPHD